MAVKISFRDGEATPAQGHDVIEDVMQEIRHADARPEYAESILVPHPMVITLLS